MMIDTPSINMIKGSAPFRWCRPFILSGVFGDANTI